MAPIVPTEFFQAFKELKPLIKLFHNIEKGETHPDSCEFKDRQNLTS